MPQKTLDKEAAALAKSLEAAGGNKARAQARIAELEAQRPALAYDALSKPKAKQQLETLEAEIAERRLQVELAELAEEEGHKREAELEERRREALRKEAEKRYDALAEERLEKTLAFQSSLEELVGQMDGLLGLHERHMAEARSLGMHVVSGRYAEMLEEHLMRRLAKLCPHTKPPMGVIMARDPGPLSEIDLHLKSISAQIAERDEQVRRQEEKVASERRAQEARKRREEYEDKRAQLRANWGYSPERVSTDLEEIDRRVDAVLAREMPEEHEARLERDREARRAELRQMLSGGEDYESLSPERKHEVDAAVEEWLLDGGDKI
jgi:hypothetical protein